MEENAELFISSEWDINIVGKTLQDTLKIHRNEVKFRLCNANLIEYETCVNLAKPDVDKPADARISLKISPENNRERMKEVLIICQTPRLEIFGENGIYMGTKYGEKVPAILDLPVYSFQVQLLYPVKDCSFKLLLSKEESTFWIYGIHVLFIQDNTPIMVGNINYNHVQQLLKDSQIPDSAKKCLDYIKNHNQKSSKQSFMNDSSDTDLKSYIDKQFKDMKDYLYLYEQRMFMKMQNMCVIISNMLREQQQNFNLDLNLIRDEIRSSVSKESKTNVHSE